LYRAITTILFTCIFPPILKAQVALQASVGLGYAAQYVHKGLPYADKIIASNISASVVVKDHHFRYRTGVEYLATGYTGAGFFIYYNGTVPNSGIGDYQIIFRHIGIPIALGFELKISKHLSLLPELGLLATYNLGASDMRNVYGATKGNHDWEPLPQSDFDKTYKRYSLFATANLPLTYSWGKWLFAAGPSGYLMTSDLSTNPSYYLFAPGISTVQKEYQLSFKLGASYRLGSDRSKKKNGN
jgi:hypothetical protein